MHPQEFFSEDRVIDDIDLQNEVYIQGRARTVKGSDDIKMLWLTFRNQETDKMVYQVHFNCEWMEDDNIKWLSNVLLQSFSRAIIQSGQSKTDEFRDAYKKLKFLFEAK